MIKSAAYQRVLRAHLRHVIAVSLHKGEPMNRTLIITLALILSLCFTGQHSSQSDAKISVNIVVPTASYNGGQGTDEPADPFNGIFRDFPEPTEEETLVKSYIRRDFSNLGSVAVTDDQDHADFTVTLFVANPKYSAVVPPGTPVGLARRMPTACETTLSLFYVLTQQQKDCPRVLIRSGYFCGFRNELRQLCRLVASSLDETLQKYKHEKGK